MVSSKHLNFNFLYLIKPWFFCSTLVWGLFLKSYEYFRPTSGATITFISLQHRGSKLSNFAILLVFLTKDQPYQKSGLQFDNWIFGPGKVLGLSRNRPLVME